MSHSDSNDLREVADGCHAYLQSDGSWGWSNAGLIVGDPPPVGSSLAPQQMVAAMATFGADAGMGGGQPHVASQPAHVPMLAVPAFA